MSNQWTIVAVGTQRRGQRAAVATSGLILLALAEVAGAAALPATHVTCGQTITESIRVANNLFCSGPGLVLSAAGITVDLGGHRLDGDGTVGSYGISSSGPNGPSGVTIRDGVVQGFEVGISADTSDRFVISGILALGNTADGIRIDHASQHIVTKNVATRNAASGIDLRNGAFDNTISNNTVSASKVTGINVFGSTATVVKGNTASANSSFGITVTGGSGNAVTSNKAHENAIDGILSSTTDVTIDKNKADGNGFDNGNPDGSGLGVEAPAGTPGSGNKADLNDDVDQCDPSSLCG